MRQPLFCIKTIAIPVNLHNLAVTTELLKAYV